MPMDALLKLADSSLILRRLQSSDRIPWDTLVQSLPNGCFMQSWAWADLKTLEGFQVFRYGVFATDQFAADQVAANQLLGGCLFYLYPQQNPGILMAPGAPVIYPGFESLVMPQLLHQAEQLASQTGAIALRIEPLLATKPAYLESFVRAPVDLLPSETLLIDLVPSTAEILAAMKPKGRYNVRLSQRHGVTCQFTADAQAIPAFYDLFWETAERQQFFGEPFSFFINLCQTLFAAQIAEIGFAYWQNQLLAAVLIVYWGDRATYLYGGRSAAAPQVMASYGLHWDTMQRAKAKGCRLYDFYGYSHDPRHSYAKFSRFKAQFGGSIVTTVGAHDYFFYDQLADTLIGLFQKIHHADRP